MELYHKYKWLSGVDFNVGSQGVPVPLEFLVGGAKICMDFVKEMETTGVHIKTINIGGGLPSSYEIIEEPSACTFQAYKDALKNEIPELFSGKYQLVTEFGQALLLKAGSTLTKVEYVKQWIQDVPPIAICHVGANQFYTEVYLPHIRRHRMSLADEFGQLKTDQCKIVDVAGPLCFQVSLLDLICVFKLILFF